MRQDVFVQNDSGGISVMSSSVVERVVDDARDDDLQFVNAHEAILGGLVGDASYVGRVVVGEPLRPEEKEQWIAHYRWALKVPCGRLLLCGGFDPDMMAQWLQEGDEADYVKEVAVPKGHYLVDVYTYLHTMNGRVIVEDVWREKLGAWFRRDHPGRAFPSWVAGELTMFSEEDPGHEQEWSALAASVENGKLKVETEPLDWVSFLFHLQPFDPAAELSELPPDGWFPPEAGLRRPQRFPLGIAATTRDPMYREALAELIGADESEEDEVHAGPPRFEPVDVFSRADSRPLTKIEGGPVEISPKQMLRLYRLPWFSTCSAQPEIRVRTEHAENLAKLFEGWEGVTARGEGDTLRIGFAEGGRWSNLQILEKSAADTWTFFPSGSVLELATDAMDDDDDREPPAGATRFRGRTEGRVEPCVWRIEESYPPLSAATLRDALALSEAAENGRVLKLASPGEAQAAIDAYMKEWGPLHPDGNPFRRKGAQVGLPEEDSSTLLLLASEVFKQRYAAVWPAPVPDDED
jgi:hypothetical protein